MHRIELNLVLTTLYLLSPEQNQYKKSAFIPQRRFISSYNLSPHPQNSSCEVAPSCAILILQKVEFRKSVIYNNMIV